MRFLRSSIFVCHLYDPREAYFLLPCSSSVFFKIIIFFKTVWFSPAGVRMIVFGGVVKAVEKVGLLPYLRLF